MEFQPAVLGLGYVGLPLLEAATQSGMAPRGFDVNERLVDQLLCGESHVDDISDAAVQKMLAQGFLPASDPAQIADCNVYVICVPTPLSESGGPDLVAVESAARTVATVLSPGDLVVLESTTYPGTTEEVVAPVLESSGLSCGDDFLLAFSPERIDPGNHTWGFRNTPKVVGGVTEESATVAVDFYSRLCDTVVRAKGTREAEMAKLLENTYRHVNIALVNEMAQFCHAMDIDLWDSIRCAATKPFGFHPFFPGPGVGGHCIPIDPNYLSHHVRIRLGQAFRFVELAQEINNRMPEYVVRRVQDLLNTHGKPLKGSSVLILGVTYKADIADRRETPSRPLVENLSNMGAVVSYWDPFVDSWTVDGVEIPRVNDLATLATDAFDCVVLFQNHSQLAQPELTKWADRILDTRGALNFGEAI